MISSSVGSAGTSSRRGQANAWSLETLRIVHLSDIHVWRYAFQPWHLVNKRALGMAELVLRRARKFRLERLEDVVDKVASINADHILITGDLTTTALPSEFLAARKGLARLLGDTGRVTIVPGNHDRYTGHSVRSRAFENSFGAFAPRLEYPWLRPIDGQTSILGFDATRSHLSAKGRLPEKQFLDAKRLLEESSNTPRRLIVACHYPVSAPAGYDKELRAKRMVNAEAIKPWLSSLGPHLFCCGHVHAAWAFQPEDVANQLCLNSGSPLLRDHRGNRPPGFLELDLNGEAVSVTHHAWGGEEWVARPLYHASSFFNQASRTGQPTREAMRS